MPTVHFNLKEKIFMLFYTNKPTTSKKFSWFISIFFKSNKGLILLFLLKLLFISSSANCQCSDNAGFKKEILSIYNSTKINYDEQLKGLLQLQQQRKNCKFKNDSILLFLLQKIGVIFSRQGNYEQAIDYTNQSIFLAKVSIQAGYINARILIDNYYNLYYCYSQLNQLQKKYAGIDSCIKYAFAENSNYDLLIDPLNDKSDYLFNKGAYDECSKNAKLGQEIIEKYYHGTDSLDYTVIFVTRQANALYISKNLAAATILLEAKIKQFENSNNDKKAAEFYILLGLINRDLGNYQQSLHFLKKGFTTSKLTNFKEGCALTLSYMGMLYAKYFNAPAMGLKNCFKAFSYANASDSLLNFIQIANIYVLKYKFDSAQYFYQQAYNVIQKGMNETLLLKYNFQFPNFNQLQNLSDLITSKGDAFLKQFYFTKKEAYLKKALEVYKKNDLFLAKIKTEQQLQFNANLVWRGTARNLYEHAIEACYNNNNIEDAFYFFEKSRSILLNDQINEQKWMEDADVEKQSILKKEIAVLEKKLSGLSNLSDAYLAYQNKLNIANDKLAQTINKLKNKNSIYYQNYLNETFITLQQLKQTILKDTKTLIEIFTGDSSVYILRVANDQQSLTKIDPAMYESVVSTYNLLLTSPGDLNKNYKNFIQISHRLFLLLFGTNPGLKTNLIISPDGKGFPFEALVTTENLQQPAYLLYKTATSYTYSIKYLTNIFAGNTNNNFVGFAPVNYTRHRLPNLYGSEKSLKEINKYFSEGDNFLNEAATKNNFLKNFPAYNIVQLYTHAADSSSNGDPIIYFSDSSLLLSELYTDRKPVTHLVVLSACETANGKLYQGEGIFSFNRGFAALGIPAAISNLWPVDNESTYKIIELFYKYSASGLPTDIALQQAKIAFINTVSLKEKSLPYYWAGAILTGKAENFTINNSRINSKQWWLIIPLILLLYFLFNKFISLTGKSNKKNV